MVISFKQFEESAPTKSLGDITWGLVTEDIIENSKRPLNKLFNIDENHIFLPNPPKNNNIRTETELELLEKINNRLTDKDIKSIEKYDNNFLNAFYEYLDNNNLKYDKEEIEELVENVETVTLREKIKFNRPRPHQLGPKFGIAVTNKYYKKSKVSETPSYPSGHASQSMFVTLYLTDKYPSHRTALSEINNEISNSRLLASVHYPIDILAGQTLGHLLFNNHYKGL